MISPKLRLIFLIFTIIITTKSSNAQLDDDKQNPTTTTTTSSSSSSSSNFQPSLFVVIGVLSFMFSLTFLLLMYAKMCYQQPSAIHIHNTNQPHSNRAMFDTHTRFSGLDIQVVEALPFFRFSSLKGAKHGLQCSVCLAEFEDVEILRLLPKCKHGFHIHCIDQWLKSHSTCPLCRQKVSVDDLNVVVHSSRSLKSEASNFEMFVEREDEGGRSSRFSLGESFRRILNRPNNKQFVDETCSEFHRLNHRIVVSDVVFRSRWSDVCSSDLMFLNSEMLGIMSSDRISSSSVFGQKFSEHCTSTSTMNIKDEMGRKIMFEHKIDELKRSTSNLSTKIDTGFDDTRPIEMGHHPRTRAMSEITSTARFKDVMSMKNKLKQSLENNENDTNGEIIKDDAVKRRKKWFHIAKKTVHWFANRENSNKLQQQQQEAQGTCQMLDV